MTIIDTDNLCGDCPTTGRDDCGGCLRTGMHNMIHGNDAGFVPDLYSGPIIAQDTRTDKQVDQTTTMINLLTELLIHLNSNATRLSLMRSFIKEHKEVWAQAEALIKEFPEK